MADKRIVVWVQRFKDRANLMLQWHDPRTGRVRSRSAGTADPKEAERLRADKEYELNNDIHREPSRMTWAAFRELFLEEYAAGLRANTVRCFKDAFAVFERLAAPKKLSAITERTISAYVAALRKEPGRKKGTLMMPSTIKVRLEYLHTALSWAAGQKLLPAVPAFPEVKVPQTDPQPVPAEAWERLFLKAEGDPQMQAYLLCGWLAGLRLAEAHALSWEPADDAPYIDLARRRIVMPAASVKGDKDQWVPLDPALQAALEALPRDGRRVFRFASQRCDELTVKGVSQKVRALARLAGVKLTMKSLRRGFGCRHAGKVPAQVLQRLMRHGSINTTLRFYVNLDEAVEAAILGAPPNTTPNSGAHPAAPPPSPADTRPCQGKAD